MNSRTFFRLICLSVFAGWPLWPALATAQVPEAIAYQGYLTAADGNPLDGTANLSFALYNRAGGGTALWKESQINVPLSDGVFSVMLGSVEPITDLPFDRPLWLGVSVNNDAELQPRVALTAVPYALSTRGLRVIPGPEEANIPNIVLGEASNSVAEGTGAAALSGGAGNMISGFGAAIGGGQANTASGLRAVVGGGLFNTASNISAVVGGGIDNLASGESATVPGGYQNQARGRNSFAAGNQARAAHNGTFVWHDLTADSLVSTAPNQFLIEARGGVGIGTNAPSSPLTVAGIVESTEGGFLFPDGTVQTTAASGDGNASSTGWQLGGNSGTDPQTQFLGTTDAAALEIRVSDERVMRYEPEKTTGGGQGEAPTAGGPNVIGGWSGNSVEDGVVGATIAGGGKPEGSNQQFANRVEGNYGTVGGGSGNTAGHTQATVGGGSGNTASGSYATVGGGLNNVASGSYATAPGGLANHARGDYSFAAGSFARAAHEGTFVWRDNSQNFADSLVSTAEHQFLIRAGGGVGIGTNAPQGALHVAKSINASATVTAHVALIENTSSSTSNGPDVLALKTSAASPDGRTNFITFFDGNDDSVGSIEGTSGGITLRSGSGDFAEHLARLDPAEEITPGEVVGVFGGRISKRTEGAERLMVVSERAIVVGNAPVEGAESTEVVAFVGQVPVRVTDRVTVGDVLVASGQGDGRARAVAPEAYAPGMDGPMVGRAWSSSVGGGEVLALVGLDEAGLLAQVVQRQQTEIDALRAELEALRALIHQSTAALADCR